MRTTPWKSGPGANVLPSVNVTQRRTGTETVPRTAEGSFGVKAPEAELALRFQVEIKIQ